MRDKRGTPRFNYSTEQRIAGASKGRLPELSDFKPVTCVDLSQSGFAFHQDAAPNYDRLVLALTIHGESVYVVAIVRHSWPVVVDGRTVFRIGCEFTDRAQWCAQTRQLIIPDESNAEQSLGV